MDILIVDDDVRARSVLRAILERLGPNRVVEAEDGEQGLEVLRRARFAFDVLLVDWLMPRLSGLEFVRAVQADPVGRTVPIIMVTGENDPASIAEAFYAGVKGYVVKPFTPETVRRKVREATVARELETTAAVGAGGLLAGTLEGVGVRELVQFLHAGKRSGRLELSDSGGRPVATLVFHEGELHDARCGPWEAEGAFLEAAALQRGRFEFRARDPGAPPPPRKVKTPTVELMIEATRRRDEAEP